MAADEGMLRILPPRKGRIKPRNEADETSHNNVSTST